MFPACVNAVNHRRTGVASALLCLLAVTSPVHGDPAGDDPPVADSHWEEVKRENREAIDAWSAAARATWSAAHAHSEETWTATEEASGDTLDTVRDGSAAALGSTRQGAKEVWKEATEDSKQLWQQAKPKVAGAVVGAAREGGKAWDAAQQAGRTFWQVLTAEDAGDE